MGMAGVYRRKSLHALTPSYGESQQGPNPGKFGTGGYIANANLLRTVWSVLCEINLTVQEGEGDGRELDDGIPRRK